TVTLTNAGADTATNVTVTDQLPAGLTFVSATPSQGAYNDITGLWTVGTVTTTTPLTLLIRATVTSAAAQTNTASISQTDQFDRRSTNNTARTTTTPQQADLQLPKPLSTPPPTVATLFPSTLTLTNPGAGAATSVTVADQLPAGLSFISATPSQGG